MNKKTFPIYYVNAFTNTLFSGNPAAVCLLSEWLPEEQLLKIAIENNLPVTAFLIHENNHYMIRWFTPEYELDLCGHGSFAAAYVIFNFIEPSSPKIKFISTQAGTISVTHNDSLINLYFPIKESTLISTPETLIAGLNYLPKATQAYQQERILVILDNEEEVRTIKLDMETLKKLPYRGITITAPGQQVDFVSRTFYPKKKNPEDAVTGAAHCLLAPYWSKRLAKTILNARQISERGGFLKCELQNNQVILSSQAVLYLQGEISI